MATKKTEYLINLNGAYLEDTEFGDLYTSEGTNPFGEWIVRLERYAVVEETELKTVFHDLYFITKGEFRAVQSLQEKIDVCLEAKPGGSKQLKRLTDELGELYYVLVLKYKDKPRVRGGIKDKDDNKYMKDLKFNMWRNGENSIALKVFNPITGEGKLTSVEHTDEREGKQMKRTHNDLFSKLKEILEDADKWEVM